MKEEEFLKNVSYSTNTIKEQLIIWWKNQIVAEMDFSFEPELLQDDEYCQELSNRVALESSLAEDLIN
jgi:hypothetical protein